VNCVNSISQMNSCEHNSLIPADFKCDKPPLPPESKLCFKFGTILLPTNQKKCDLAEIKGHPHPSNPELNESSHPESCPSSPRSHSSQSSESNSHISDFSGRHQSPDRLMSR